MTDKFKTKYFPQFSPTFWEVEYSVYGIPFVDEISIGFVERENGVYSYLLIDDFLNLDISPTELLKISINNLENEFENCDIKEYKLKSGSVAFWNSENDNFTAIRILSSKYSSVLKNIFKQDFYFSIPDRDIITCWLTTDKDEIEKFKNEIIEDFENSEYGLSNKIYKFSEIKIND
jgi:hypothetical protein